MVGALHKLAPKAYQIYNPHGTQQRALGTCKQLSTSDLPPSQLHHFKIILMHIKSFLIPPVEMNSLTHNAVPLPALQRQREILKVTSGCQAVDQVLGGGFETRSITEMYGEFRSGKTQLCLTLCVTCQLPVENGGAAGKVSQILNDS